jgi:hypothetical protein
MSTILLDVHAFEARNCPTSGKTFGMSPAGNFLALEPEDGLPACEDFDLYKAAMARWA